MIQIVPRLGSPSDGVADYARTLAAALRAQEGIDTLFVRGDPLDAAGDAGAAASIRLEARSPAKVVEALDGQARVLLHYANYGYAPRGCPSWLVDGLEQWKRHNPRSRLLVMFHELYASGPPWRSSFWTSPIQRRLAARLARLSDVAITSSGLYRGMIAGLAPEAGKQVMVLPVFSTIGEPRHSIPWRSRKSRLAVLGRSGTEVRVYGRCGPALAVMLRSLRIEEVVDIGPRSHAVPAEVAGIKVRSTGQLPRDEVSALLSGCRAGFLDYPSDILGKSTVFAAYCAHGAMPVITHDRGAALDGLTEGKNYLLARTQTADTSLSDGAQEEISNAAFAWYGEHDVAVQAGALARLLA